AERGEAGAFGPGAAGGRGGPLPLNTDGGGLSSCHPGMRGIFLLIESVRQLRGQAGVAQVPDCEVALAIGSGGWLSCIGAVLLGKAGEGWRGGAGRGGTSRRPVAVPRLGPSRGGPRAAAWATTGRPLWGNGR